MSDGLASLLGSPLLQKVEAGIRRVMEQHLERENAPVTIGSRLNVVDVNRASGCWQQSPWRFGWPL